MASVKGLVVLCLLHLCVQTIQGAVNPAVLAKMIQYFDDHVQPKPGAQYAIAITVPEAQCTKADSDIKTVFSVDDAETVKNLLTDGKKCVLCTPSQNVIAARPIQKPIEHAEHVLLYPIGKSPMDDLLKKADQNSCIVFYSYNSPCVTKCIQSQDNILDGLANWKNKRKGGMNVFVFEKIWQKDEWRKDMEKDLLKIEEKVPLYRCDKNNKVMECQNCVQEKGKVIPFCLPKKKSLLSYFQEMLFSMTNSEGCDSE